MIRRVMLIHCMLQVVFRNACVMYRVGFKKAVLSYYICLIIVAFIVLKSCSYTPNDFNNQIRVTKPSPPALGALQGQVQCVPHDFQRIF